MKIAVSAKGGSLTAAVDERFGRCEYFVIVDSETNKFNAIFNPGAASSGGQDLQPRAILPNIMLKF